MLAQSSEFENMQVREDELPELDTLAREVAVYEVRAGPENKHGKVNILLQVLASHPLPPPPLPSLLLLCSPSSFSSAPTLFSLVRLLACYLLLSYFT